MRRAITISILPLLLTVAVVAAMGQRPDRVVVRDSETSEPNAEPQAAEQWEYLVVAGGNVNLSSSGSGSMRKEPTLTSFRENFPLQQNLDKLGAKGWELVQVSGGPGDAVYYFRRRK